MAGPGTPPARRAPAALVLLAAAAMHCGEARAAPPPPSPCATAIAVLNEGKAWEAFDRDNGGADRRLRFRLDGREETAGPEAAKPETGTVAPASVPSSATKPDGGKPDGGKPDAARPDDAKPDDPKPDGTAQPKPATRIEIVARGAAGEGVVATVALEGRSASYCFLGASRVDMKPDRRTGCPGTFLRNFLQIRLVDGGGPFVRRDVDIEYLYRPDAVATSLDRCSPPRVLDGMFRRGAWTVTREDGAAVRIGETDFPRDRRAPVPADAPFATTVTGH